MAKTYVPSANDKAQDLNKYLTRWAAKMSVGATTDQLQVLAELLACVAQFLAKWPKPPPQN